MKTKSLLVIAFLFINLFSACSLFNKYFTSNSKSGESSIVHDAIPPKSYNPNFVTRIDTFRVDSNIDYKMNVMNTEIDSGKVKIWFNITDTKGVDYIDANLIKWDSIWCLVEEKIDTIIYPINNYKIFNFRDIDTIPNAFVFVLDHSGSMGEKRAYEVQNAIANLVKFEKRDEDAFAIIKYDGTIITEVPLTNQTNTILSQFNINGLSGFGGWTAINDGLNAAVNLLGNATGYANKTAIVFTDGLENSSTTSKDNLINNANKKGIKIFTIDFGGNTDGKYLQNIADKTGGCYYHIYGTNEFNFIFKDIYKRMKNIYVFEYTPAFFGQISFTLQLCNDSNKIVMQHNFEYKPEAGNFTLVNIYFDSGKNIIKKQFNEEIIKLSKIMKQYPNIQIEIGGYTDNQGSDISNQELSQRRAEAVKNAIVKQGINQSRITAIGYGESKPIAENDTKKGRARNRRTEFVIIKN